MYNHLNSPIKGSIMKITSLFLSCLSATLLTACATSPVMKSLPKQEPGKATVALYSPSLPFTSSFSYAINNQAAGDIEGGKLTVVYLTPGHYHFSVNIPHTSNPLTKEMVVRAGQQYFLKVDSNTSNNGRGKTIAYHLESVPTAVALQSMQGPKKFTGWQDLITNSY
jgi:hypothetical protein